MMNLEVATAYAKSKHPGKELTFWQIVEIYMGDHPEAKQYPAKVRVPKPCPACGNPMKNFTLCSACKDYAEGFRSRWICPSSEIAVNTKAGDQENSSTYKAILTSMGHIFSENLECTQAPILDKEYHNG